MEPLTSTLTMARETKNTVRYEEPETDQPIVIGTLYVTITAEKTAVSEFDQVIWEGSEEDEGDTLRLIYSSQLDLVALQSVTHDTTVLLEPQAMASLSGAFLSWAHGTSLN